MKCELITDLVFGPDAERPGEVAVAGTIIDHHQAWLLVRNGVAIPADDECTEKAAMTAEQMAAAKEAYRMQELRIQPDDREAFRQGIMAGYDARGNWLPGPNYDEWNWQQMKDNSPLIITGD